MGTIANKISTWVKKTLQKPLIVAERRSVFKMPHELTSTLLRGNTKEKTNMLPRRRNEHFVSFSVLSWAPPAGCEQEEHHSGGVLAGQ